MAFPSLVTCSVLDSRCRACIEKRSGMASSCPHMTVARPTGCTYSPIKSGLLTSRHSPLYCHFIPRQSAEKVRCSIIPLSLPDECSDLGHPALTLNEQQRELLCELRNSAAHDRQLLSEMSVCQRVTLGAIVVMQH